MLKELRKRIYEFEKSLEERQKRIISLEKTLNAETLIEKSRLEAEIEILNKKLSELKIEYEKIRQDFQRRLPELEKQYLERVEKQKKILAELYEKVNEVVELISTLKKNVDETRGQFYPYRNVVYELEQPIKHVHLEDVPSSLRNAEKFLNVFLNWYRETRGGR
ncbi:MAG: hypothetical protein QXM43_03455 [Desulfurococcaceae archaeon]